MRPLLILVQLIQSRSPFLFLRDGLAVGELYALTWRLSRQGLALVISK